MPRIGIRRLGFVVAIASAGWIIPLWLGISTYIDFVGAELWPLARGEHPMNSFPFLQFTRNCLSVALVWLAVVAAFWAYIGYGVLGRKP